MKDERPEMSEPRMSEEERAEFYRRRRSRNLAMLGVLVVLVAIFYAISMVRVGSGGNASRDPRSGALAPADVLSAAPARATSTPS